MDKTLNEDNQVLLRKATLYDVEEILDISSECRLNWSKEDFKAEIVRENSLLILAENESENIKIGFISVRLNKFQRPEIADSDSEVPKGVEVIQAESFMPENEMDVVNFGVLRKFRRLGIGKMLFEKVLAVAAEENVGAIWLEVRESNGGAVEFYRRCGFVSVQVRKHFYADPLDNALLMTLKCRDGDAQESKT